MLSIAEATARIQELVGQRSSKPEMVPIDRALGRILARDITARRPLPPLDNSAMDGFALRSCDVPGQLSVLGTIAAGDPPGATLGAGQAWRIMTGAPLPAGADTVVIREDAVATREQVTVAETSALGDNIRRAGEDIGIGDLAVAAGARIGAGEIGLMAALGHAVVPVSRQPRVAIMSTGDELVGVDVVPGPGQIVNSNAYALAAQVREAGGIPVPAGIAPDRLGVLVDMLRAGLECDVLLTSGGVSVGDFDHVKRAFADVGVNLDFWKVAMKPGKPLAFGASATGTLVFGLPGNPVSSMLSFEIFARPALLALQGATRTQRVRAQVRLTTPYRKRVGRTHFVRARLQRVSGTGQPADAAQHLVATPLAKQGSGMISSMVGADALLEIPAEVERVAAGAWVSAILLTAV